jgi:hypothetical protein
MNKWKGHADLRRLPVLYNELLEQLRPENCRAFAFPDDIISMIAEPWMR